MSATAIETYDSPVDKPVEDLLKRAAARAEKSLEARAIGQALMAIDSLAMRATITVLSQPMFDLSRPTPC